MPVASTVSVTVTKSLKLGCVMFQLYGEIPTIVHFVLLAMLSGTLLAFLLMVIKMQEVSETAENFIPVG